MQRIEQLSDCQLMHRSESAVPILNAISRPGKIRLKRRIVYGVAKQVGYDR
jgi:hypothetical protein